MGRIVRQTAEGPHLTRDTDQVRAKLRVSRGFRVALKVDHDIRGHRNPRQRMILS